MHLAGSESHCINEHHLFHNTAQLQKFVSILGLALNTVTSLELNVKFPQCSCDSSAGGSTCCKFCVSGVRVVTSRAVLVAVKAAATHLLHQLFKACPNLCHVGGGGSGATILALLLSRAPNITSMQIFEDEEQIHNMRLMKKAEETGGSGGPAGSGGCAGTKDAAAGHEQALRFIKLVKVLFAAPRIGNVVCKMMYKEFPSLTHLELGEGWLELPQDWLLLPKTLIELRCKLAPFTKLKTPAQLQLAHLRILHAHGGHPAIELETLTNLLRALPSLQLLSMLEGRKNRILIEDTCVMILADNVHYLRQRLIGGCNLVGVSLQCSGPKGAHAGLADDDSFPFEQLITAMPSLPSFVDCTLLYGSACEGRFSALSAMARTFPDLQVLVLEGNQPRNWQAYGGAEQEKAVFGNLQKLILKDEGWLTAKECLRLVSRMPKLTMLMHSSKMLELEGGKFQVKLRATQRIANPSIKMLPRPSITTGLSDGISQSCRSSGWSSSSCRSSSSSRLGIWVLEDMMMTVAGTCTWRRHLQ